MKKKDADAKIKQLIAKTELKLGIIILDENDSARQKPDGVRELLKKMSLEALTRNDSNQEIHIEEIVFGKKFKSI